VKIGAAIARSGNEGSTKAISFAAPEALEHA
jgi:hypothetical protein